MLRQCTKCNKWKSLEEFYEDKTQPGGYHSWCKECKKASVKQYQATHREQTDARIKKWRRRNPERVRAYSDRWKQDNPEATRRIARNSYWRNRAKCLARMKEYYHRNREECLQNNKEWCGTNPEKRDASSKKYRETHRKEIAARSRAWRQSNPEKRRYFDRVARAKRAAAPGTFTIEQWEEIKKNYAPNGICLCCGKKTNLTADHVIPLTKGGSNYPSNLQPLCKRCNSKKYTSDTDYRPDQGAFARSLCRGGAL